LSSTNPGDGQPNLASSANSAALPEIGRRVLFYSHDGTGLGHLRITLGIARAYAERRPQDSLLLLTGSLQASAFELPTSLDYVKLPAMPKRDLYASLPPTEGYTGSHNSTVRFRTALAKATVEAFAPHLVVVDHAPAGLFREFVPALEWLCAQEPRPRLALLMRDITFGPEQTREIWTNEGVYPLLDQVYDRILVYGDRRVFDPVTAYGMSAAAAAKTRFCGYLAPAAPRRAPDEFRRDVGAESLPLIVVTTGGGADGGPLLRAYAEGLREQSDEPVCSYIVAGPLLPAQERQSLAAQVRCLPNTRLVDFDPDVVSAIRAADAVVSMGGYNSLVEAVHFGKQPIVVPRTPGPEEQCLRAAGLARLGLATMIEPAALSPVTLWQAVRAALTRPRPAPSSLPFGGLDGIAEELVLLTAG
jgi:predicted glycosyltransferase